LQNPVSIEALGKELQGGDLKEKTNSCSKAERNRKKTKERGEKRGRERPQNWKTGGRGRGGSRVLMGNAHSGEMR